jgi:uncharacterized protein (DUF111 family)
MTTTTTTTNTSKQKPQQEPQWERPTQEYHAHFDCFSGAAGDMMLAACLDTAGGDQQQECLLRHVTHCLSRGMPELSGEFEITARRVWRGGMGSIAGLHVHVTSRYHHAPAPVPKNPSKATTDYSETQTPTQHFNDDNNGKSLHSHGHEQSHEHSHRAHACHEPSHLEHTDKKSDKNEPIASASASESNNHHGYDSGHEHSHDHSHSHSHSHQNSHKYGHSHESNNGGPLRNLPEIKKMLEEAPDEYIAPWVRTIAIAAFTELAMAEAQTHGAESMDTVHFHEVGAVDSIVDTVGTLIALYSLGVTSVSCSRLPMGEGTVWTDHGLLPVPAPATLRLLVDMPVCQVRINTVFSFQLKSTILSYSCGHLISFYLIVSRFYLNRQGPPGVTGELVTPTGAALLRALTKGPEKGRGVEGRPPNFTIRKIGVGAGTKDYEKHPNVLRLIIGDSIVTRSGTSK